MGGGEGGRPMSNFESRGAIEKWSSLSSSCHRRMSRSAVGDAGVGNFNFASHFGSIPHLIPPPPTPPPFSTPLHYSLSSGTPLMTDEECAAGRGCMCVCGGGEDGVDLSARVVVSALIDGIRAPLCPVIIIIIVIICRSVCLDVCMCV